MSTSPDVNYDELARSTDEFNGAQLKAVCVEAGMIALREGATKLGHEHFLSGIAEGELSLVICQPVADPYHSAKQEKEQFDVFCIIRPHYDNCIDCTIIFMITLIPCTGHV